MFFSLSRVACLVVHLVGTSVVMRPGMRHSILTDATVGVVDFTSVTEFAVSSELLRQLGSKEPEMPNVMRPRVMVAPQTHAFGLFRMFQLTG
jgi:hypothetical protein